ncbi:zinc finger protein 850 [Megalops cyprinoides]|uniref:zinc finger protein 850 n=1 Tax=Megalops cyprinoides TaxID=118141 RepID=UPI0018641CCD|nr:zinc finger protein 850 [Megalops cyprinoides]
MAAVYIARGGREESNDEGLSSENNQAGTKRVVAPAVTHAKKIKVEESGWNEDHSNTEQTPPRHHPEASAMDAAPAITIKEERIEDDEYIQIKLGSVGESLEESTENNESERDNESADGDWLFRCVDCGEAFGQEEAYLEHQREHVHDGPIVCLDSDSQWDDLLVSEDGGRRTLCCALCGRKFSSSRGFFTHQLKHRNEALKREQGAPVGVPKQRIFECEDCGKTFSSVGLCLNHQRSHKQASKSVFHELAHLKKKSFQCPTCGRCYSRASALDAHRLCHEVKLVKSCSSGMEKPVSTQDHPAENGDSAVREDKTHKPLYECSECGRAFRTLSGLSTHQRCSSQTKCSGKPKEDAKRSFKCPECEKSFHSITALAVHQRWHTRRAQMSSSGQSLSCEECGKVLFSLTLYHKHQRIVHSGETAAKSFLHQVCQLQKKAFECQDCGRRFSRATALQSHQLCHANPFGDVVETVSQKPTPTPASALPSQKLYLCDKAKPERYAIGTLVYSQDTPQANENQEDLHCSETNDTAVVDENENVDFLVEVVSMSGSEDSLTEENEPLQESSTGTTEVSNSEREENKEKSAPLTPSGESPHRVKSKAEVDIEVNFGQKVVDREKIPQQKKWKWNKSFQCPECDRKFISANAVRCHRLWHRGPMGRAASNKVRDRNVPTENCLKRRVFTCSECGKESSTLSAHHHHLRKHEDRKPYKSLLYQLAGLQKNSFKCEECGMRFSRASALQSHQQHHKKKERPHNCPLCDKSYSSHGALYNHHKACHSRGYSQDVTASTKKETFNPRKTLLGPKVYHCEKCGKGFWSSGAFSQHKQQHCGEVKEKSDLPETHGTVNGRTRSLTKKGICPICRRRFRHRGILACHMKQHRYVPKDNHICLECGKSYRLLACFLKHQQVHNSQGSPPPVKSFQHQVEQLEKNTYGCPDCGKRFSRAMALQFHMRCHGFETGYPFSPLSESPSKADVFQCSHCPAHFSSETELQGHLSEKHVCNQSEVNEGNLDGKEQRGYGDLSQFPSQGQASVFAESEVTSSLMSLPHTAVKSVNCGKYQCNECGRSFSVVGALNFHKRIHLKEQTATADSKPPVPEVQEPKSKEEGSENKGPYICPECGRTFGTNSALGTHRRWHTDKKFASSLSTDKPTSRRDRTVNEGPFRCNQCGKGFFYFCVLRRHQMHHPSAEAETQSEFTPDSTQVVDGKPSTSKLSCPKCDKTFSRASFLAAHYQSHHAKASDCVQCSLSFSSERDLLKHRHKVHSSEESDQPGQPDSEKPTAITSKKHKLKPHGCPDCGKRFFKVRGLRAHRWQAHRKTQKTAGSLKPLLKPFTCTGCEKRYSSQGALYNHRKICVVSKRKFKGPKTVEEDDLLPYRTSEHTRKFLFKCHKCGKDFPSIDRLEAHKDIAKSRPYCCALCCRGYWSETQLQQHLVWHDEVRRRLPADLRYRLSTYSSPAGAVSNSVGHVTQNHLDIIPAPFKPPSVPTAATHSPPCHKCPHCGEAFQTFLALQEHQTLHGSNERFHCSLCPRTFSQIHELIDHHQECMSDDREQNESGKDPALVAPPKGIDGLTCIECGLPFSNEMELHQHYIEHARGEY